MGGPYNITILRVVKLNVSNNFRMIYDLRKREIIMEKKSETLFSERKLQGLKDRIFVFTLKYVHLYF